MDQAEEIIHQAQQRLLKKRAERGATENPIRLITKPDETVMEIVERAEKESRKSPLMDAYALLEKYDSPPGLDTFSANIPARYLKCKFDTFTGNDKLTEILKGLSGESILLTGGTGTGKTHLAVALMKHINKDRSKFITVPTLLMEIRDSFRKDATDSEMDIVDKYSYCNLLCLDDLGAEKSSEFSIATLYLILDKRVSSLKQTIVTTNLSLAEIEATLGARIASRLSEMRVVKINMPDFRKRR